MKILLFGKNGQIGKEIFDQLSKLEEVVGLDRGGLQIFHNDSNKKSVKLVGDLTDLEGLRKTIYEVNPQVIINAAAYTAVDKAEDDIHISNLVNSVAVDVIAKAAKEVNALFVHYSTDYVFDGSGETAWLETDNTNPINHYGLTKLNGEKAIISSGCKYLILRTSWVYGFGASNFAKTILQLAKSKENISVIDDQIGAPSSAAYISRLTIEAIQKTIKDINLCGLYHLVPRGECSWFEYADYLISNANELGLIVTCNHIHRIKSNEYPMKAKRPLNSRLNASKFELAFNLKLLHWQIGLNEWLYAFKQNDKF